MEREEKKYTILPGVKTPDIKAILGAASDFSSPGVESLNIKNFEHIVGSTTSVKAPTAEEIASLNSLGDKVAAEESRVQEESRKKMQAIKNTAVMAPEDLSSLQKTAAKVVSAEKREIIEKEQAEIAKKQAEEEAKNKMREERRLAQQKALEEALARKKEEEKASNQKKEEEKSSEMTEEKPVESSIASEAETLDDFSEFL